MACPLLALFGHPSRTEECPLSGAKRTRIERALMSANEQHRAGPITTETTIKGRNWIAEKF